MIILITVSDTVYIVSIYCYIYIIKLDASVALLSFVYLWIKTGNTILFYD